jgi:hypothetical protein
MQTARVTDMRGGSENPHELHVSPHDKVKVWHTESGHKIRQFTFFQRNNKFIQLHSQV